MKPMSCRALRSSGAQATPWRARCHPWKYESSGGTRTVAAVSRSVRLPDPGRMLARSNHVKSKSDAEHSTELPVGSQPIPQVSLVATATT
jgi:hypothetical protein